MKLNRISYALIVALAGTIALAGCKKKEEAVRPGTGRDRTGTGSDDGTGPAPVTPPASPSATPPPPTSRSPRMSTFGTKDKIIVSVKTDAATAANAAIDAKLTYQDGQVAGQQTANVMAEDAGTTNVTFSNANPWPAGKYKVDVTVNGQPAGMTQEIEVK